MLEAQGRGIEAQNQKRLALVSSLCGLTRGLDAPSVISDMAPTLNVLPHEGCAHITAGPDGLSDGSHMLLRKSRNQLDRVPCAAGVDPPHSLEGQG